MTDAKPKHKGFYILPNIFTTASLFCGFLGIMWAISGRFEHSALAILASALLDGLDGKVARLTNSQSDFGVQFDSLSDLVAFGVSPAITIFLWNTHHFGRLGFLASFLLMACAALRLARFNVQVHCVSKKYFIGMPTPASACTLALLILVAPYFPEELLETVLPVVTLVMVYALSFLMVSRVRYLSFKDMAMVRAHPFTSTVTMILLFVLVATEPKILGFLCFLGYMISGLVYTFVIFPLRRSQQLRSPSRELS
ncbi:MAG: CDP-diacylglycerol--serine O-phosphatidyltransferase [Desulfovibrionales bacterium]